MTCCTNRSCGTFCLLSCVLTIAIAGCGPSEPSRQEISGSITWDGEPLSSTSIVFRSQGSGGQGVATEVTDGEFQVSSEQGPTPGLYDVVLLPVQPELEDYEALRQQGKMPLTGPKIPHRYQHRGELTAEVKADQPNRFVFEISSKR
ncbi:hypothetical protein Poly24_50210 [Rosistilla carotiformis]|uniref:Carboxypeptidase regulatory-like domain-containing protein n=1 Tax=Rosistilla carotiformis TaxID=2528017 RepID=A0A518K0F3_9BACT|nr:hypothetical protein Poly24_50210 [Rosistilla carotiformis]